MSSIVSLIGGSRVNVKESVDDVVQQIDHRWTGGHTWVTVDQEHVDATGRCEYVRAFIRTDAVVAVTGYPSG